MDSSTVAALGWLLTAAPRYFELSRSQRWSAEKLHDYRQVRLEKTLRAAMAIPFYAARFQSLSGTADFARLPILQRAELAALNRSVRGLYPEATRFLLAESSGTTGDTVELLFDPAHQRGRFAARARYLIENGWDPLHRSAWIIALRPQSTPDWWLTQSRLLPGVRFLSHIEDFETQVSWLRRVDPHFLYSLPSNLEGLLSLLAKEKSPLPSLRRIFTGGEVLETSVRARARDVLGVDIADNYGSNEMFLAWQCPAGSYHVNEEHVMVEILDEAGKPTVPGHMGRVVATTLENMLMPLIRYDMGDYAIALDRRCPCGRALSVIGGIVGRGINLFRLANGKLLSPWRLVEPLKHIPDVKQLQVVQRAINQYTVRFVNDEPLGANVEDSIRKGFSEIIGSPASVSFEKVSEIERAPSGKFMAALCMLEKEAS